MPIIADRYIHLDADKEVALEVADPREAWVLCIPGEEIEDETVKKYNLGFEDGKIVLPKEGSAEQEPKKPKKPKKAKAD